MTSIGNLPATADAVVVGGGTIGAWTAWFLKQQGLSEVVLVEADRLGQGASSRAAGMVRAQGGTEVAIRLGMFSEEFYRSQFERFGIDSGFVEQGYFMPCFSEAEVSAAHTRIALQQSLGLDVRWVDSAEFDAMNPAVADGLTLGASYAPGDGYIDPPMNVLAYTTALFTSGVRVVERTAFTALRAEGGRVVAVQTTAGEIATDRVVLAGGPSLKGIGERIGARILSSGVRHQVVTTAAHPDLAADRLPMVFDVLSGIYWRPDGYGGVLWGMSNPDEAPGIATEFDWGYYETMRARVAKFLPATEGLGLRRTWAATIDFTPDNLPLLGPLVTASGEAVAEGVTVAAAGGHGMMWGPAIAKAAADLATVGTTDVVDVTDLGLDRFDEQGRSTRAAEPIALPFPDQA
ncbi:MAG: FAD-binding oxidoreductase [Nocardioidaceae bacterium]